MTWDHRYPIVGDPHGPHYEGWLTITAWPARTERIRIGLMVGANPNREPSLAAKMATTLDHISGGRAILGIGAAWFEGEAHDFGFEFGSGAGTPALATPGTADHARHARRHQALRARGLALPRIPRPEQPSASAVAPAHLRGRRREGDAQARAEFADMNNVGGGVDEVRRKERVLLEHCTAVGRNPDEIERTTGIGTVFIRDDRAEAERASGEAFDRNRTARRWTDQPVGTPEDVAERLAPYRHLIAAFPATYDEESMTRLVTEVTSLLQMM